ncbi:hypothetical protein AX16_007803 [Volvariella volvacea WC 439]|nr:hypothetical protein AX16_007803 [Volvariella volvacea WC 439]
MLPTKPSRSSTCSSFSSSITNSSLATISTNGQLDSIIEAGLSTRVTKALKKLEEFDTVLVVDNMQSMASHRFQVQTILHVLAPLLAKYDQDGFDLHLVFNSQSYSGPGPVQAENIKVISDIMDRLSYCGKEPGRLFEYIDDLLKSYLRRHENAPELTKPVNYIIITNGDFGSCSWPPRCVKRATDWLQKGSGKLPNQASQIRWWKEP